MKCKGHKKRDQLLILKMEFDYQIFQQIINFTYRSSFLNLGRFHQRSVNHSFSRNSKSFKALFVFTKSKFEIFQKTCQYFLLTFYRASKQADRGTSVVSIYHATTVNSNVMKTERRTCLLNKRISFFEILSKI